MRKYAPIQYPPPKSQTSAKAGTPNLSTPEGYRRWIVEQPGNWTKRVYGVDLFTQYWTKPVEIIQSVFENRRTAVRGCVASSKSVTAAIATHAWLQHNPRSKVFLTAPSDRQVKNVLWAEVRALHQNAKIPIGGNMLPKESRWDLGPNWYAMGFSTDDPNRFHGIHGGIYGGTDGGKILFIIDEAQGIDQATFDAIENVMSDGKAHLLLLENPTKLTGEAYDAFNSKRQFYNCITIASRDTPNVRFKKVIIPGMITYEVDQEWRKIYGENSNFVRVKLDAEFPNQEPNTLIPMDWIELAMERVVPQNEGLLCVGCDVAWEGDDDTVIASMRGRQVKALEVYHGQDTMVTADKLDVHLIASDAFGYVDAIGIGAGVYSREAQRGRQVHAVVVSEDAIGKWEDKDAKDHFQNLRAQVAWKLREALDPSNPLAIALPKDLQMQAQMSAIKYKTNETSGKIQIQPKKDMKKDLGYSPDKFDAIALANWGRYLLQGVEEVNNWAAEAAISAVAGSETEEGLLLNDSGQVDFGQSQTLEGLGVFRG